MKFKQSIPYDILISPTPNNGFICTCGCVKVVYSGITTLIHDLKEYLENPEDIEKQYNKDIGKLGRVHIGPIGPSVYGHTIRKQESEQQYQEVNHENS